VVQRHRFGGFGGFGGGVKAALRIVGGALKVREDRSARVATGVIPAVCETADPTSTLGLGLACLLPIAVAGALVPLRDVIVSTNVALALVVTVVVAAIAGGRQAGAVAAVMSVASYDFFFTQPYLSLRINSRDDVETAVLLLVVGLIVGTLASRARREKASAAAGRTELQRIFRIADQVARGDEATAVISSAQVELTALLGLEECRFEAPPYGEQLPRMERSGVIAGLHDYRFTRGGFELPASGVALPVLARGQQVARFVLRPTPDVGLSLEERVVAVALADQVGGALAENRPSSVNGRSTPRA